MIAERTSCSPASAAASVSQASFSSPGEVEPALGVGRGYLGRFPEEASHSGLEGRLLALVPDDVDSAGLRSALVEAIRADFDEGRTFRHEGWVLSRTGGRLCALAALTAG